MYFKIIGEIKNIETIATGHGIKNLKRLNRIYGNTNWRKLKGVCRVRLDDGTELDAEVHWYEGHGAGKKEFKIRRYL
jgi:hypothetical protein